MERPLDLFYDHLSRGDLAAAGQLLTEDSVLHVPGRSPNTGTYRGREAVIGFVAGAARATGNTLRMTVHRVLDDGEWTVAIATYTATRPTAGGDAHLENNLAHVARLEKGLVAESWLHSRDQYEVDEFWSDRLVTRFVETRVVPADLGTTRAVVLDWTRDRSGAPP